MLVVSLYWIVRRRWTSSGRTEVLAILRTVDVYSVAGFPSQTLTRDHFIIKINLKADVYGLNLPSFYQLKGGS
jgi:hypothetical protein